MRVIICGGRDFNDKAMLRKALDRLHLNHHFTLVIDGGYGNADNFGHEWARDNGIPTERYFADWDKQGLAAGPIRNQRMLDKGRPHGVVAFPTEQSRGTWDMVKRAKLAGLKIFMEVPYHARSGRV